MDKLDIYKEFGATDALVSFLPDDFFPTLNQLLEVADSLFGEQLTDNLHHSPHHTALRHLLMCAQEINKLLQWLRDAGGQQAYATVVAQVDNTAALHLRKAIWFHTSCLTFGQGVVLEYLVSFGVWIRTPAPYRPANAPILTTLPETCHIRGRTPRGTSPAPRRRRSQSPGKRRSPSPRGK
ncbi:core protein [Wufeng Crocidura attenuata orthohepadnavirus 1]|uniref:Core protein n=1 Tax=Asian grey shrew hepatitis B virus TaxID=2849741 RepID=A0AC61LNG9_9HEPA|nr:core protein [Asian grey shrew hepatitis B virus]QAS68924.1 core protein [Shrew hepatitis B virus]UOX72954.1 core protein [Wufeng Crocidura attenuata orthohepadnavirus 1]QAS68919.1 core protein [Asian grey shrew hepatitis B virus]QAS68927.1 core protein [Shrew hepatitis B virus]QAS68931.1 core protein [Shrew hepatitis B virus]